MAGSPGAGKGTHGRRLGRDLGVPHIAAGAGWVRLDEVRPAGKRTMPGAHWARGARDLDGLRVASA